MNLGDKRNTKAALSVLTVLSSIFFLVIVSIKIIGVWGIPVGTFISVLLIAIATDYFENN